MQENLLKILIALCCTANSFMHFFHVIYIFSYLVFSAYKKLNSKKRYKTAKPPIFCYINILIHKILYQLIIIVFYYAFYASVMFLCGIIQTVPRWQYHRHKIHSVLEQGLSPAIYNQYYLRLVQYFLRLHKYANLANCYNTFYAFPLI